MVFPVAGDAFPRVSPLQRLFRMGTLCYILFFPDAKSSSFKFIPLFPPGGGASVLRIVVSLCLANWFLRAWSPLVTYYFHGRNYPPPQILPFFPGSFSRAPFPSRVLRQFSPFLSFPMLPYAAPFSTFIWGSSPRCSGSLKNKACFPLLHVPSPPFR